MNTFAFLATPVTPLSWVSGVAVDSAPVPKPSLNTTFLLCYNATWDSNYTVVAGNLSYMSNDSNAFANPSGLFISGSNLIYVSDTYNCRIQRFNPGSSFGTTVALTSPFQPIALYVDQLGTIYSCEQASGITSYGRLQKYVSGNMYGVTLIGGVGNCGIAVIQLCSCRGIYIAPHGLIYISDTSNHRVLAYNTTAGSVSLVAGTNGIFGFQANQLYNPSSLYVDDSNNLFILDSGNGRIQQYAPGSITGWSCYASVSKSLKYRTSSTTRPGRRLLCISQVALGDSDKFYSYAPNLIQTLEHFHNDEYAVYNLDQLRLLYLVELSSMPNDSIFPSPK
ncbi:unnamed protein product [Rotaria sp. Silwood1]|nr:unnamed protein product [Rotaria sp. Silwood1]CAF3793406.1 unnamed protein product [Rotaria sp. Silwood1]CAF4729844.1 unnamed protein product [Rotaria sp. Silwood1]CAF4851044.1 unnamed protein product [Rotaria sp. Silwood1]